MASYSIYLTRSTAKELESVPSKDRKRLVARIEALADAPRPVGVEKLSGDEKYRIRQGNYRSLYWIDDDVLVVTAVRVGQRQAREVK